MMYIYNTSLRNLFRHDSSHEVVNEETSLKSVNDIPNLGTFVTQLFITSMRQYILSGCNSSVVFPLDIADAASLSQRIVQHYAHKDQKYQSYAIQLALACKEIALLRSMVLNSDYNKSAAVKRIEAVILSAFRSGLISRREAKDSLAIAVANARKGNMSFDISEGLDSMQYAEGSLHDKRMYIVRDGGQTTSSTTITGFGTTESYSL